MSNFQYLLETPLRWALGLGDSLVRSGRSVLAARREREMRRRYMNG